MLVVTAGTADFLPIIQAQARECARYGYKHLIYDLGGLGMGIKHAVPKKDLLPAVRDTQPPTTFKLELLPVPNGETVCWLDGDCLPMKPFEPPGYWDAAVTLRPDSEIIKKRGDVTRFLNAGVVWIRDRTGRFLDEWQSFIPSKNNDQAALNVVVGRNLDARGWMASRGKQITTPGGFKVQVLDAMEWNCWYFPPPKEARILHFKKDRRHLAAQYLDA